MIHGTPVLDIKPYIADYDTPQNSEPLEDLNVQHNHHKSRAASDSCDQRLLPGCEKALHCRSAEEKLKCLEDRTPEDTFQKPRTGTETRPALPGDRERTVGVALESSRSAGVDVAEEQRGLQDLRNFLDKGTDRSGNVDRALVLQGNRAETQWASFQARTADRAPCSVPAWVKEAPAASLQVRFTPHAEMDLRKLSSGGKPAYLGSPRPE